MHSFNVVAAITMLTHVISRLIVVDSTNIFVREVDFRDDTFMYNTRITYI